MKKYILLKPEPVQRQITTVPAGAKPLVLFIGLDVHNDSIAVSLAPSDSAEVRRYGIIGGEHDDVIKLVKKLQAAHPGTVLKFCYEAGPRGFALCRCLRSHGLDCILVCPSKVPRKPGERVKTDRRDADDLARLYRAGELTGIYVPEPEGEAMRKGVGPAYLHVESKKYSMCGTDPFPCFHASPPHQGRTFNRK